MTEPNPTSPEGQALARMCEQLMTQVRRITDALSPAVAAPSSGYQPTGVVPEPTQAPDTAPPIADDDQVLRWARRESLLVLLTRVQHGRTLTDDEARTLRHHVETEMREAETARAVARGNLRHVRAIVPELEHAQAAIERVRALATSWAVLRTHGSAATELRAALDGTDQSAT